MCINVYMHIDRGSLVYLMHAFTLTMCFVCILYFKISCLISHNTVIDVLTFEMEI